MHAHPVILYAAKCRFSPDFFLPNVVWALTPTVSGTFEATTFTIHIRERARLQNSVLLL